MNCLHGEAANQPPSQPVAKASLLPSRRAIEIPTASFGFCQIAVKRIFSARMEREEALIESLCLLFTAASATNCGQPNLTTTSPESSCFPSAPE